jgi:type I restriction enzyme S subunit
MSKLKELIDKLCPDGVEYKKLGDNNVSVMQRGSSLTKKDATEGPYPVISGGKTPAFYCDKFNREGETITVAGSGAGAGYVQYWNEPIFVCDAFSVKGVNNNSTKYLYYCLTNLQDKIYATKKGGGVPHVHISSIDKFEIPLPPIEVQEEIVRILDNFTKCTAELQAELQAREEQYEYYRNKLLSFEGRIDVQYKKLGEVCLFMNGKGHEKNIVENGKYIVVNSKFISTQGTIRKYSDIQISPLFIDSVLMVMSDLPNGKALAKCFIVDKNDVYTLNQRICSLTIKNTNKLLPKYLFYITNRNRQLLKYDNGVDQTNLRKKDILNILIPIPTLTEQQRIVDILDRFDILVNDISQGLPAELEARQNQYEYYRNKLLTFDKILSA